MRPRQFINTVQNCQELVLMLFTHITTCLLFVNVRQSFERNENVYGSIGMVQTTFLAIWLVRTGCLRVVSDFWKRCGFYRKSTHVIPAFYKNSSLLKRLFLESVVVSKLPLHLVKGRVQKLVHRLGRAGALPVIRITVVVVTQESPITSWSLHVPESTINESDQVCDRGCQKCLRHFRNKWWCAILFCAECVKSETLSPGARPNLVTWIRARTGNIFRRDTRLTHIPTSDTPPPSTFICQLYFRLCNPERRQIFEAFAATTANNYNGLRWK